MFNTLFFFIFSCSCVFCGLYYFCSKLKPPLSRLSLSRAFFGSLMLSADDDDQNGDGRAAAATREEDGELVLERRQLVYVESWFFKIWRYKSKMFLSYFSRFVLLLRRYSRYAFALGTTAIAIGAIVFNTNRRIE